MSHNIAGTDLLFLPFSVQMEKRSHSNESPDYALDKLVTVVWQLIARHLNGYDIMSLLMTCSRGIVGPWRHSKIGDFEILPTSNPRWTGAAFGSLQHLNRLQCIKLHASGLKVLEQGPQLLLYLPPQLVKLSLAVPSQLEEWLLIPPRLPTEGVKAYDGRDFGHNEARLTMFKSAFSSTAKAMLVDLNALLPELEELELIDEVQRKPHVFSQNSAVTPKSKSEVKSTQQALTAALAHFYSHLPSKKLSTLHMAVLRITEEDGTLFTKRGAPTAKPSRSSAYDVLANLPNSLRMLSVVMVERRGSYELPLPPTAFASLPRSLSSLSINIAGDLASPVAERHKLLAPLGGMKSLTSLSLSLGDGFYITSDILSSLSPTTSLDEGTLSGGLVSLKLDLDSGRKFPVDFISSLPKTLEELEIKLSIASFPSSKSIGSELPQNLKIFKFLIPSSTIDPIAPRFGIQDMPSGLIELDWGERCKISDTQVKALPSSLETLRLDLSYLAFKCHPQHCSCNHYFDPEDDDHDPYLPPRVVTSEEESLERSLSDDAALNLPQNLSTLIVRHSSFGSHFFMNLPATITHLEIDTDRPLEGHIFFSCALQYLFINAPMLSLHALSSLPHTLRTLRLIEPISSPLFNKANSVIPIQDLTLAADFIALLPPSITDLHITGARDVTDEAQWPPSLTNLVMTASSFLTELSLPRPQIAHKPSCQKNTDYAPLM